MSEQIYLVCVPWGQQQSIPSVMKQCAQCTTPVAVDEKNVAIATLHGMIYWCLACALKAHDVTLSGDALVGGERVEIPPGAREKFEARRRKQ